MPEKEKPTRIDRKAHEEKTQELWNERALTWREDGKPHPFFTEFCQKNRGKLGEEALDLGCGPGIYLVPFAKNFKKVAGFDLSPVMIERARTTLQAAGLTVDLQQGVATNLPYESESFSFVASLGVLHHYDWEGVKISFAEAVRVLKPEGYFMMQVRSVNDMRRKREKTADNEGTFAADVNGPMKKLQRHHFTEDELRTLGSANGLEITEGPIEMPPTDEDDEKAKQRLRWWVVYHKPAVAERT